MSKRPRPSNDDSPAGIPTAPPTPLGATELCSILNGDDPRAILKVLRRFVTIVQSEKTLAVGSLAAAFESNPQNDNNNDDDDDDEDEYDEMKESQRTGKKRSKKDDESWKEDTANYNVPFVGTSISSAKDKGRIVKNQWPCGLLLAYLEKSPNAAEFVEDHLVPGLEKSGPIHTLLMRQKKFKLAPKLSEYYLKALAEIVSCAIPIERLRNMLYQENDEEDKEELEGHGSVSSSSYTALVSSVLKQRLGDLFHLLQQETGGGKGKSTVEGGCGPLTPHIMTLLVHLAQTNLSTARHLARSLEQERLREGILRFLIRSPHKLPLENTTTARDMARVQLVKLVTVLLSYQDSVILTCISSPGSRGNQAKVPSGLLYLVCKEAFGLNKSLYSNTETKLSFYLSLILRLMKQNLLGQTRPGMRKNHTLMLLSGDFVVHLVHLSLLSPMPRELDAITETIDSDMTSPMDPIKCIAETAQGFLYTVAMNKKESPFLQAIEYDPLHSRKTGQSLVRMLLALVDGTKSGLSQHNFVQHCLEISPTLVPDFLSELTLPDPKNHIATVTRLHFMSKILLRAPPLEQCFFKKVGPIETLKALVPSVVKKNLITKLLRSTNFLVVAEVLRMIIGMLRRLKEWSKDQDDEQDTLKATIMEKVTQERMPEIRSIVVLFQEHGPASMSPNPILFARAADALVQASHLFPSWVAEANYDWLKLIPNEEQLLRSSTFLQSKLLHTLYELLHVNPRNESSVSVMSATPLFKFLLKTKSRSVYDVTRKTLVLILSRRDTSTGCPIEDLEHEAFCWIDGLHSDCLDEFLDALRLTSGTSFGIQEWMECAKIWKETRVEVSASVPASSLLLHSLRTMSGGASPIFMELICQVAARSILFRMEPIPLSAVIASRMKDVLGNAEGDSMDRVNVQPLRDYCTALVSKRSIVLSDVLDFMSHFIWHDSWLRQTICSNVTVAGNRRLDQQDYTFASRYMEHCLAVSRNFPSCVDLYRKLCIPLLCYEASGHSYFLRYLMNTSSETSTSKKSSLTLFLIISSCQEDRKIEHGDFSFESSFLEEVLTWFVSASFCSYRSLLERLLSILSSDMATLTSINPMIAPCIVRHLESFIAQAIPGVHEEKERNLADALFRAWERLHTKENIDVLTSIQDALGSILQSRSKMSNDLCLLMESAPSESVVARALTIEHMRAPESKGSRKLFSELLIEADSVRYSSAVVNMLMSKDATNTDEALFSSKTLPTAIKCLESTEEKQNAALVILKASSSSDHHWKLAQSVLCDALLCFSVETLSLCPESDLEELGRTLSSLLRASSGSTMAVIKLASKTFIVCRTKQLNSKSMDLLGANVLSTLCTTTEKSLRKDKRDRISALSLDCLESLCGLWTYCLSSGKINIVSEEIVAPLVRLVRSSVKYAMGKENEGYPDESSRQQCLRLVLLTVMDPSSCQISVVLGKSYNSLVFQWITSHSSFRDTLSQNTSSSLKVSILRILLTSLSSTIIVPFEPEVWSSILSGYTASMSLPDRLTRRILYVYSKTDSKNDVCRMSNVCGGSHGRRQNDNRDSWEWLPFSIDMSRVHATLESFPYTDTLEPVSSDNLALPVASVKEDAEEEDIRYSPGFLLPLALSALEAAPESDVTGFYPTKREEYQCRLLQKLCDKGVLALTIASLCCECADVRRVAVAVLSYASVLIRCENAQKLSSWRDRPQIELILDSTRRALLREAMESSTSLEEVFPVPSHVVMVPPPCAIFLAKASLILSSPRDDLYPSLNRYFLRIDIDHGAVQDIHRFPCFVPLFCSSTTTENIAFKERYWAVETFRDGFINEACFRPMMGCHAFELLLTRLEVSTVLNAAEFDMLVSAVSRVVERCGQHGLSHLVSKVGLLAWLSSSFIAGRLIPEHLTGLTNVLNLLSLVIDRCHCLLSSKEIVVTIRGLPEAILREYRKSCDISRNRDGEKDITLAAFQRVLLQLKECYEQVDDNDDGSVIGIRIPLNLTF